MKHAFNHWCIVLKDTGEITVEQKRINNALMENRNAIIKLVTKAANGYRNWERFRNRYMLVLEKGIDFEIDKDDGSIKIVEKMDGYPNFLGGSKLGGNLGDNNEK